MLGSLTLYRRLLHDKVFNPQTLKTLSASSLLPISAKLIEDSNTRLPVIGHAIAGVGAGWTVSFIAAPVEHIKARLQVQYAAEKSARLYSGPIDCTRKIVSFELVSLFPNWLYLLTLTNLPHSSARTASAASTTASLQRSSSEPSFSCGGPRTTC